MHYIASCAPPAAAIRVPAEYFLSSPCSLKSVSRPKFHTLRSAIRPRQAPCSCRLCQRVVREGHLSVLAPNCEVLVMSPFFGFPSYISSETTRTLSVHCTCLRPACVVGEWDFVWGACTLTLRRIQRMAGLQVWTWAFAPGPPSAVGTCQATAAAAGRVADDDRPSTAPPPGPPPGVWSSRPRAGGGGPLPPLLPAGQRHGCIPQSPRSGEWLRSVRTDPKHPG